MAHQNLPKIVPLPQLAESPQEQQMPQEESEWLSGLAWYLSTSSSNTHSRFEYLKVRQKSDAEHQVLHGLRELVNVEAERRLLLWIQSHPRPHECKPRYERRDLTQRRAEQKRIIRRAYERFGCDFCGTKESPHVSDGLCSKCYTRRQWRRNKASLLLAHEEESKSS